MESDSHIRLSAGGVVYTVSRHSSYSHHQAPHCTLLEVFVNSNASVSYCCFFCSGYTSFEEYRLDFITDLTLDILFASVLQPNCYRGIAKEVSHAVLLPANHLGGRHIVRIQVQDDESALRNIRRKAGACKWVFDTIMARQRKGARDKAEKEWKESGDDHNCAICFEEIPSAWESRKLPCSHVFHAKCVFRWIDVNPVCPLCRFEFPDPESI